MSNPGERQAAESAVLFTAGYRDSPEGRERARKYSALLATVQDSKCWDEDEGTYFTACADGKCRRCAALKEGKE